MIEGDLRAAAEREFRFVRETLFPTWDHKRLFSLKFGDLEDMGVAVVEYSSSSKRIIIYGYPETILELQLVFAHEICHSSSPWHGELWRGRMFRAAKDAHDKGLEALSLAIVEEAECYHENRINRPTPEAVYDFIRCALRKNVHEKFDVLIRKTCVRFGISTDKWGHRYPECAGVYYAEQVSISRREPEVVDTMKRSGRTP